MDSSQDELAELELHDGLFNHRTDTSKLRTEPNYHGFDNNCGDSWIYPTNYPVRQYQYNICQVALFRNTLVVLPTGLGKTLIAAVVMYNMYRWYPRGKVIFMAPTRPLVAQQIEACYQIMGISKDDTAELTGKQGKAVRESVWRSKRVFYCTPQVLAIDLLDPCFPVRDIKLIVVDEAHKAHGKYAYTEVIRLVSNGNANFRVLALSATPGRSIDDVIQVVRNLHISHIEVRSEKSPDVVKYTHKKNIQTIVVKLDQDLAKARNDLLNIIEPYVVELTNLKVVTGSLTSLTKGWIIMQQKQFLDACRNKPRHVDYSNIMSSFSTCISLYHGLELLEQHGFRIFLSFFEDPERSYLLGDKSLRQLIDRLRQQVGPNLVLGNGGSVTVPFDWDFGHPKYGILRENLLRHFSAKADTRALVFCEFRESVYLIEQLLEQNRPLLRPKLFVGQGSSNGLKAVTQKQQVAIMNEFRAGLVNVLIATCVAEEGMDVGEIDLIVCFDISTKNPTRFVQRIGRTGRRRDGCVLMLCTEGKEHRSVKDVLSHRDKTNQDIANNPALASMLLVSPRMVPSEFDPKCIETFIRIDGVVPLSTEHVPKADDIHKPKEPSKKQTKAKKTCEALGTQDVRNFFKPIPASTTFPDEPLKCPSPVYDRTIDYPDSSMSISTSTPKQLPIRSGSQSTPNETLVLQTVKKLRSLKLKILRNPSANTKTLNISSVLKSAVAPQSLQRFALATNVPYLESQMLSRALPLQKGGLSIDELFGGAESLRRFVQTHKDKPKCSRAPLKEIQLNAVGATHKFEAMDKEYFPFELREPIIVKEVVIAPTQNTQIPHFIESESRYVSFVNSPAPSKAEFASRYVNSPAPSKAEFVSSTPVSVRNPSASKQRNKKSPRSANKQLTPIKKAFQRLMEKQEAECSTKSPQITSQRDNSKIDASKSIYPGDTLAQTSQAPSPKWNVPEILRFFRLNNVLDIFAEEVTHKELDIGNFDEIFISDDEFEHSTTPPVLPQKTTHVSSQKTITSDLYIGSLDDIFVSDEDEVTQKPLPAGCTHTESDDSIPASQSSSPQHPCRTLSSKLAVLSQKLLRQQSTHTITPQGVQPTRQISTDMFEVTSVLQPISLTSTDDQEELSSSLKENVNEAQISPLRNSKSPAKPSAPFADNTRSPSLLGSRMSFSRLMSMSKSQRAVTTDLGRFNRRLPPKCLTTNNKSKVTFSSSDDDDDFETNPRKVQSERIPCGIQSRLNVSKSVSMADISKSNNTSLNPFPSTQDNSPIRLPRNRNAKRVVITSSSSEDEETTPKQVANPTFKKPRVTQRPAKRKPSCVFLDQDCAVSGSDSGDEDCDDTVMLADLIDDDHDTTHETTGVDMQAIYMQSVRSPIHRPKHLAPRGPPPDVSFIFSQAIEPDVDDYEGCSFVVNDDEADRTIKEAHQKPLHAMCPLERAEFIIKQRRRAKRLGIELFSDEEALSDEQPSQPPKKKQRNRRRVVVSIDSSEDDV